MAGGCLTSCLHSHAVPSITLHIPHPFSSPLTPPSPAPPPLSPGLNLQRVRDSVVGMREAELALLEFVRLHAPEPGSALLAGNSVHIDRMFLQKYMPELTAHLSYR